jgi:hypothetical protein
MTEKGQGLFVILTLGGHFYFVTIVHCARETLLSGADISVNGPNSGILE